VTRVAGIDCGTNSIRLLIADLPDEPGAELRDVTRRMEIVRLGQGVDRTGRLAAEAIERTRLALVGYAEAIADAGATKVRMVATSASRDASNAAEFREMVHATLGQPPEVVTGGQEAELSFRGAVVGLPPGLPAPYLVVDIGGGSTEFVRGTTTVESSISVDIGCVRMTERHLHDDPPTPAQVAAARAEIASTVERALSHVDGARARTVVGLAGSVTTVVAIALGLDSYQPERIHHTEISTAQVTAVTEELLGLTRAQRLALPVMHPGRADVIGAGSLILQVVLDLVGAAGVVASEHDILDGICYSLTT
jgi:exopolyphosphatase/guanosine-5'-triphosphate,3'-diphosphate pyrophosphatase